ncbi:hypothetical protein V2J09_011388 [Rumex salicifolius]
MMISWILNTIELDLRATISYMENAKDLWEDIKERFAMANSPRVIGLPLVTYYGKMKHIWKELQHYNPIPTHSCELCTCNVGNKVSKKREEEKVHQFLMDLNDTMYGTPWNHSHLSTRRIPSSLKRSVFEPLPEKNEEKEKTGNMALTTAHNSSKSRGKGENKEARERNLTCSHCNKRRHEVSNCYKLIGYPEGWGERPRYDNIYSGNGRGQPRQSRGGYGCVRGGGVHVNVAQSMSVGSSSRQEH